MDTHNYATFCGIKLLDEPIDHVLEILELRRLPDVSYIVTPNADHFYRLDSEREGEFVEAYRHATIRLCDSRIIQKLSYLEKSPIKNVIPGSDLTLRVLMSDWVRDRSILVVGPDESDIEVVRRRFSLKRLSSYRPPMGFIHDPKEVSRCIDLVDDLSPDLVFLAVGSPQQEQLALGISKTLSSRIDSQVCVLCVGASFDFLTGKASRAPRFVQLLHFEWLYRALTKPYRLIPRYSRNFVWLLQYAVRRTFSSRLH